MMKGDPQVVHTSSKFSLVAPHLLLNVLLYNSEDIWDSMIDGAKQPENFSLLRLMGMELKIFSPV